MMELTPREKTVRAYLCKGFTNKEIAKEMKLSPRTIEDHRVNIFKKLKVRNIVELVRQFYGIEDAA